jgi:hypothetical protein
MGQKYINSGLMINGQLAMGVNPPKIELFKLKVVMLEGWPESS